MIASSRTKTIRKCGLLALALLLGLSSPALAQDAAVTETAYIFNTLLFLLSGFLVMFMAAGFAMLEAGLVRSTSVVTILSKNITLYSVAGLMYYVIGYNLMYAGVDDGYYGTPSMWSADDSAALSGDFSGGHAAASDWFFQMVFVATAASIVSGTVAERVKLLPFVVFVALLTGILYPITGSWQWGGGWLSEMGFSDFAGSTIVHSVGGWAALTGVLLIGPRIGRYDANGKPVAMPGSSLPLATLGTFILWLGWFGFNGGSQLELGSAADAVAVSNIFVNTNIAAAAGCVTAMALTHIFYKKTDITMVLNGALAGLVSITAEPLTPSLGEAAIIGAVGGLLVVLTIPMLDKFKIDDVVGAIPVHLICGIWGTIAVPITNPDTIFVTQLKGIMAIGAFTIIATFILWNILKFTVGIRISEEQEMQGIDSVETGMEAYPDFVRVSKR